MKRVLFITMLLPLLAGACNQLPPVSEDPKTADLQKTVNPYLQKVLKEPDWLYSRLQMYWSSHATQVYVNGEKFDHAGGDPAPVATVKFCGTRGMEAQFDRPKLEDIIPYDDDANSEVHFINKISGKMDKAHPSKTGTGIQSINHQILSLAAKSSKIYQATGIKEYGRLAKDVFETYMLGIYYRNTPIDIGKGHIQTLVGLTTFEVIHEDTIYDVTEIYPNIKDLLDKEKLPLYDSALKKWAENIIANGVPHNNWNLFQAEFIAEIALVLEPDSSYRDGKGKEYYLDYILHKDSIRQWSLSKLAAAGFDDESHTWYEAAGYSTTVLGDFGKIANRLDEKEGIDIFKEIPALQKALFTSPQYLMPNRMIVGFGDTHPGYLNTNGIKEMIKYAERHSYAELLNKLKDLLAAVSPEASDSLASAYVTPTFYAPNESWIAMRSGMNPMHDLMVSMNGSIGNHQHANGISMELYGKGYVLAPDAGIGKYLYSGADYNEYYSRFPAHNTVCVDGVSDYPVMMSQHAFSVLDLKEDKGFGSHSVLEFREPETNSRQIRVNSLVKTSGTGGYYIDIFRSRRADGGDKFHDYFFHAMGQEMTICAADGSPLNLEPTDELAFAGGHLYAYSYIHDKYSAKSASDIKACFITTLADSSSIFMNMWMKGYTDREVFKALSPANLEYERIPDPPYKIDKQPVLTYVARQCGEAWSKPFVAVYEPSTSGEPSEIESVDFFSPGGRSSAGIRVKLKNGMVHTIVSSESNWYSISSSK